MIINDEYGFTFNPNQRFRITRINKENAADDYIVLDTSDFLNAAKNLDGSTFKLYMYLASHASGMMIILWRQEVKDVLNMSYHTYTSAFDKLVESGYLVENGTACSGNKLYDFYTHPRKS